MPRKAIVIAGLSSLVLIVLSGVLWKSYRTHKQDVARKCLGHLKVIGTALQMYESRSGESALDGAEGFAEVMERLVRSGIESQDNRQFLRCCERQDYILIEDAGEGTREMPNALPVLRCPDDNCHDSINVLYSNGVVHDGWPPRKSANGEADQNVRDARSRSN